MPPPVYNLHSHYNVQFHSKLFRQSRRFEKETELTKMDWDKAKQRDKLKRPFNERVYGENSFTISSTAPSSAYQEKEPEIIYNATFSATDYDQDGNAIFQVDCKVCGEQFWIAGFQAACESILIHQACR